MKNPVIPAGFFIGSLTYPPNKRHILIVSYYFPGFILPPGSFFYFCLLMQLLLQKSFLKNQNQPNGKKHFTLFFLWTQPR
jgi:hypothetical protein